jgi:hypothetical protein
VTTICADAREGIMCADSLWTDGVSNGITKKVFRIRGDLLGGAGGSKELDVWFDLYRKGKPLKGDDEIQVLRLRKDGKMDQWYKADGWTQVEEPFFAIGTGGQAARAAMYVYHKLTGSSQCAASVRAVYPIVAGCGGPVRTYRLQRETK